MGELQKPHTEIISLCAYVLLCEQLLPYSSVTHPSLALFTFLMYL